MGFISPTPPGYDIETFRASPFEDRVRLACLDWVRCGFGAPGGVYVVYLLKVALWIGVWYAAVSATPGVDGGFSVWWNSDIAFQKAIVWTMLFEGLGFGCGSGPLTARYFPPFIAFGHFLKPGTIRLPADERIPGTAGTTRSIIDVLLYAVNAGALVALLLADTVSGPALVITVVALPLLGLRDKTIFLAHRSEHYWVTMVVFLLAGDRVEWIAGAKAVQLAIWWWAATSKLNRHFPAVVAVMLSNHPLNLSQTLRSKIFKAPPEDLRPGTLPTVLAHGGTVIEYSIPLLLVLSSGGAGTQIGLIIIVGFHLWIFSSFALGVPQEWNILFIYSALVLFGGDNAAIKPWEVFGGNGMVALVLVVAIVALPIYGNLRPERVSFLPSMRYYAGNWGTSTWIFTPEALRRFDEQIPKLAPEILTQLSKFYPDEVNEVTLARVSAFRAMHQHGRLVQRLIARAVEDPTDHVLRDGELVAGMALGWNFGEGHLHHEQLLTAVQERCHFKPGELRVVMVESQPLFKPWMHSRIHDASDGLLLDEQGSVAEMIAQQPWPDPSYLPDAG